METTIYIYICIMFCSEEILEQLLEFSYSIPLISWQIRKGLHVLKHTRHFVSTPNF